MHKIRCSYLPILFLFVLGGVSSLARAQEFPPKVTPFIPDEDYEAHHQVFCVEPLLDGRTAFGTSWEILIHDGEGFRHIPVGSGKTVFSMDRDPEGRLFVGGSSTMGVVLPDSSGKLAYRSLIPLLPDSLKDFGIVWDVMCTEDGEVYFNCYGHLFCYEDGDLSVISPKKQFFGMHSPSDRPIVQGRATGLFRIDGTEKILLPGSKGFADNKVGSVLSFPEKGGVAVFTETKGVFSYDPQKGTIKALPGSGAKGELASARISTASRLNPEQNPFGASFVVGTKLKGLYFLDGSGRIVRHVGRDEGIPSNNVWDIVRMRGGHLWVTTNQGIALVHIGIPFTFIEEGEGYKGVVQDIFHSQNPDTPMFLSTTQGVWAWDESKNAFSLVQGMKGLCFDVLPFFSSEGSKMKRGRTKDPDRLLVGGAEKGLLSFPFPHSIEGGGPIVDKLFSEYVNSMASSSYSQGKKQVVLAGGRNGLFLLPGSAIGSGTDAEPILSVEDVPEEVLSVGIEHEGNRSDTLRLWASFSSKGVMAVTVDTAFSEKRITRYDTSDGLPEGTVKIFSDPMEGKEGVIFGTEHGFYRSDGGRFRPDCRFGKVYCSGDRPVYALEKGAGGSFWIFDGVGGRIKHFIPAKDGHHIDSTLFQVLDNGPVKTVHSKKDGTWIGGERALVRYHPQVEQNHDRNWDCLIRNVFGSSDSLLFGGNYRVALRTEKKNGKKNDSLSKSLSHVPVRDQPEEMVPELQYSENRLLFHFAAPFTDRQEAVEYSYKLSGFDTAWSAWGKKTQKEYTNLPEGNYTFKVKGRNVYLNESSTAEYRFRILPPWYRTWTAYGGYTIAGIGFIWFLMWINSRRLIAQKERLERIVEERTKEIQQEKKEVERQKERVEEQQKETEKQREEAEKQKEWVEEAHKDITQSIDYAQKIQYALLQSEEHVSPHLPEHFILFKPQSQVSGDFYWAREHMGHLYIAAVDCTGHGVPGAFMSMLGISQLNEIMATDELLDPGEILTELRDRVVRELSGSESGETAKDGMDAALLRIPLDEEEPRTIRFAGAQNPLYVVRKGIGEDPSSLSGPIQNDPDRSLQERLKPFKKSSDGIEVKGDPMPVGYDEYASGSFATVSLQVQRGAMLYIFSDGYADQFGGKTGKKFRYGPFKKLLAELHERPVEEQKQELDHTFEDWRAESEQEQIDDVVVVGVRL